MQYRPEIDGLRTIAVLPVILFHAGVSQMSGGYIGVDVFFVISGFLITGILARELEAGQFSLLGFYERRARRILPSLVVVLAATMVAGFFLMLPYELAELSRAVMAVILFVSNILFWRESGYFAPASELNPLLHTWSLAIEEQYYILFPLLLWACWKWCKGGVFLLLVVISLGSLALAEMLSTRMPLTNFYLLPTRAWELLAGSLTALYLLRNRQPEGWCSEVLGIAGLAAITYSIFAFDASTPFPSLWAVIPVLGTVAIILGTRPATLVGRFLSSPAFVGIGLISYSAYLWHQPLFAYARLTEADGHPSQLTMLGLAGLSLILAWISWRYVESPFRRRDAFSRAKIFALSGASGVALSGMAAFIIFSDGLPNRYPAGQQAWISTSMGDYAEFVREAYRDVVNQPLSDDSRNMVLVGDSFSQDFYNVIKAADGFVDYQISAIYVPARCQMHFGLAENEAMDSIAPENRRLCTKRQLTDAEVEKMRAADVVVFAFRWQPWAARAFDRILTALDLPGQIVVVGSKSFEKNRRALLSFDPANVATVRKAPEDIVVETSDLLKNRAPEGSFVNLVDLVCDEGCPLFTTGGELISYDGKHLTPAGAQFIAERVFSAGPLSTFAGGDRG